MIKGTSMLQSNKMKFLNQKGVQLERMHCGENILQAKFTVSSKIKLIHHVFFINAHLYGYDILLLYWIYAMYVSVPN